MITKIVVLEIRDGQKYTYPIDSSYGLHCIAEELKHHKGEKSLSPSVRALGEIVHLLSKQIQEDNTNKGEKE